MYGVSLTNNIIVASGSVVCHSFSKSNIIIGGNPAHIIGTWDGLKSKSRGLALNRNQAKMEWDNGMVEHFIIRKEGK